MNENINRLIEAFKKAIEDGEYKTMGIIAQLIANETAKE